MGQVRSDWRKTHRKTRQVQAHLQLHQMVVLGAPVCWAAHVLPPSRVNSTVLCSPTAHPSTGAPIGLSLHAKAPESPSSVSKTHAQVMLSSGHAYGSLMMATRQTRTQPTHPPTRVCVE